MKYKLCIKYSDYNESVGRYSFTERRFIPSQAMTSEKIAINIIETRPKPGQCESDMIGFHKEMTEVKRIRKIKGAPELNIYSILVPKRQTMQSVCVAIISQRETNIIINHKQQ